MFIDEVDIWVKAGHGGRGCLSFRREKFVPNGGPDGGDGGRGGHVILEVDSQLSTLVDLRYRREYKARKGGAGQGSNKHGKNAEDLIIRVPPGTLVKDVDLDQLLVDLATPGEQFVAANGGLGGRGNARFKTATNRAPRRFQPGLDGEERHLHLELKLLADIGIIGFPNVGKSTLISRISAARPKIADYPFTTIIPNLGVVRADNYRSFVVVDIPGLIEGASEGLGLGIQFLRHIERTKCFVHLIDVSSATMRDPVDDFHAIQAELGKYNSALSQRPQIVVASKIDILDDAERLDILQQFCLEHHMPFFSISAVTGHGVSELVRAMTDLVFPVDVPTSS